MPSARFHTLLIAVKLALQLVLFGTVKMGWRKKQAYKGHSYNIVKISWEKCRCNIVLNFCLKIAEIFKKFWADVDVQTVLWIVFSNRKVIGLTPSHWSIAEKRGCKLVLLNFVYEHCFITRIKKKLKKIYRINCVVLIRWLN
jgi:hypothetical protein